ncbi:MAG: aminotransferase class IV, partial [Anderseniella sp.]
MNETSHGTHTHATEEDVRNKDIRIWVNGDLVHRDEAKVSVYDAGFMLGDGMWEGMRLYDGKWAFYDEHMDRLYGSCKAVGIDIGMTRVELLDALNKTA